MDTGNNAWVGLSFAHFAAASGEACYAMAARDILDQLRVAASCNDALRGFSARLEHFYRSTEHNVDVYALARMLDSHDDAEQARSFVHAMYAVQPAAPSTYATGTGDDGACDASIPDAPVATDTVFWNLLASVDPVGSRKHASVDFAIAPAAATSAGGGAPTGLWTSDTDRIGGRDGGGCGRRLWGFRFTSWWHGIQWENMASGVMALLHYRKHFLLKSSSLPSPHAFSILDDRARKALDSLRALLPTYGCVPASIVGGNYQAWTDNDHDAPFPGGSDTRIGWTYLRYPHVAATAWTGLLLL